MNEKLFTSIFAQEIYNYLDYKVSNGCKRGSFYCPLKNFDSFCIAHHISLPVFSREHADEWIKRRKNEATTTHYSRVNGIKHFLSYISKKGYDVFITRDIAFKKTLFQPHIYSNDEIRRYFTAVDAFHSLQNKKNNIQYPILFRLLYCCGTRINETLGIRKQDIDLNAGIVKLSEAKNNCERYIVLNKSLLSLMRQFAEKCFYLLNEDDYIFTSSNGKRCSGRTIYQHHRLILKKADIPFIGNGEGPRIHDWRDTFAVNSFKQLIDAGNDLYVSLPILSSYLGHKTIFATERYVRLTMNIFPYIERKFKGKITQVFGEGDL